MNRDVTWLSYLYLIWTGWTFSETVGNELDRIKPNSRGNITIYGKFPIISFGNISFEALIYSSS